MVWNLPKESLQTHFRMRLPDSGWQPVPPDWSGALAHGFDVFFRVEPVNPMLERSWLPRVCAPDRPKAPFVCDWCDAAS